MASKNDKPNGFNLAGTNKKYGFRTVPNESVPWRLQSADGKYFGDVSYDAYKAVEGGTLDSYKAKNDAEKNIIAEYRNYPGITMKSQSGTDLGKVTYDGYVAISNGKFDSYTPKSDDEKAVFEAMKKEPFIPFSVEIDGETKDFGNVSYNAYKAIESGSIDTYETTNESEKKAINSYISFVEEYAKKQREPEGFWQGLAHGTGYTLEKIGAGAVDGISDAGSLLLAGGATLLRPFTWGSWNKAVKDFAGNQLAADSLGDLWDGSIESRYRVPDWYREYLGTTAYNFGSLVPALAAEYFTASASPLLETNLADMAGKTALKGTVGSAAKTITSKLIKPKASDVVFGLSSAGSAAKAGYAQSGDVGKSLQYGVLNGLGEVATEKLFGGLGGTGIGADDLIDLSKIGGIRKIASNKYGEKILSIGLEGVEEMIMAEADPIFQRLTVNPNAEFADFKDLGESAFQGILLSAFSNVATLPIRTYQKTKAINILNKTTESINAIMSNDTDKFEPLKYNATEAEIEERQKQIKVFSDAYSEIAVNDVITSNPDIAEKVKTNVSVNAENEKISSETAKETSVSSSPFEDEHAELQNTELPALSVGDVFRNVENGMILKVIARDENNTIMVVGDNKTPKTFANKQADLIFTNEKYEQVESTETAPNTETEAAPKNITLTRAGDFYEAYGDEAVELSNKLGLTLTSKTVNGKRVQMVGFPVSTFDSYKNKLGSGYNISVSDEQISAKERKGSDLPASFKLDENGKIRFNQADIDYTNSEMRRGEFRISKFRANEPKETIVRGWICGKYGVHGNEENGAFVVTHLQSGIKVTDSKKISESKRIAEYFNENLSFNDVSYIRGASGTSFYPEKTDEFNSYTNEAKNILDNKLYAESVSNEIENGKVPFSTKAGLVDYVKSHIGNKISVSLNNGTTEVRTLEGISNTSLRTKKPDGTVSTADLKGLKFSDTGFSVDYSTGVSATFDFVNVAEKAASATVEDQSNTPEQTVEAGNDTLKLTDKCELVATKHTSTGDDIWVITLKDRISPEEYKDLSGKVKTVGGYYSRFAKTPDGKPIPGFVFKTEPTAKEFKVFNDFFKSSNEPDLAVEETPHAELQSVEQTAEKIQKETQAPKIKEEFKVGDVLEFDGEQWKCVNIDPMMIDFVNVNKKALQQNMSVILPYEVFKEKTDYKVISQRSTPETTVKTEESLSADNTKITVGMSDSERAELLNKKRVNVVSFNAERTKALENVDFDSLQKTLTRHAKPIIEKVAKDFGILNNTYFNPDIELDFEYSNGSLKESINKQHTMYGDFVKMLSVFSDVINNAVGIETHADKYKGTIREDTSLKQMYVLASALSDEKGIIPVKLAVKELNDKANKLYLSVVLTKKESRYPHGNLGQNQLNTATPTSDISIADLVSVVNPSEGDFLKYFPDSMLDSEQIAAKNKALASDAEKLKKYTAPLKNSSDSDIIKENKDKDNSESVTTSTEASTDEGNTEFSVNKEKGTKVISKYVALRLQDGEKISIDDLVKISNVAFAGSMADNAYTIKDVYDAMELGVNQHILSMKDVSSEKMLELLELLPTQTKRTEDMIKYQQFSTPPSIAYLANYAANVNSNDIMLEPSAGIGGIAVFAKKDGAAVYVNELDERRLNILKNLPFDGFWNENAEQLDNILGGKIEPTVIVMNPPFSSSSERNIQNTKIGAKHIEQALKILAPNGRLVAIVGHGMEDGAPAFRNWWKDIKSQYNVRANIRINGKNYNKYGTNFDIQMLVIDKNGATTHTETGNVDTLQELQEKLGGIRDERPAIDYSRNEQRIASGTRKETFASGKTADIGNSSVSASGSNADKGKSADNAIIEGQPKRKGVQSVDANAGKLAVDESEKANALSDENRGLGTGQPSGSVENGNAYGPGDGDSGQSDIQTRRAEPRKRVKHKELTDSIFEHYQTQPLLLKNTQPHPAKVSESAAMSAIEPPVVTYKPNIPQSVVENGVLSDVQLEAISYAGQSHSQTLPNGNTRGFFLGDGTGIGKGRTIAGMMLDNYNQGRKKSLWVTLNSSLVNDAKRDVKALFGDSDLVTQFVGGNKADSVLNTDEAIMVISYSALSKGFDSGNSNFEKIVKWLGKDFDGLIVFDEAHKMGNATATKGTRGIKKASQTGLAGIALQEALPKAKIVYSSATGATEVENLRYAERLGLWGEGTAFVTGDDFVSKIKAGGLAAMELIARDMKAMGVYLSRNISYEDVRYDKITHKLTGQQKKIYDELARSWQIVLNNINKALDTTNQSKDGTARGRALGAFWSSQQRFFNQILTSMQVPSVIADIEKQLADGKSCVIQLVSTNEAAQNEEFARLKAEDLELDEFDLTPKQMLMSYIENSFPVQQFEEYRDDEGNVRSKPVYDSKGNPVMNREAVRQREELLAKLGSIKVPSSPIDMIINHFGTDMVAENTGRVRRVVQKDGKFVEEKIGSKKDADVDAFQNGNKRIIIFSKAGGTGKSYHADRAAKNQQQRVHYLLEAGWQADNAVQGFGRSHRSNQASAPIFKLVTTDLKGQMRFISTIAKRLDQLGAMTKGQRQAGGQGMFSASDNLENSFAADVLAVFYKDLIANRVDGIDNGLAIIEKLGLKEKIVDDYNRIIVTAPELREVNKFLNRILSLESSEQNTVFDGYSERLQDATEKAMLAGTLDKGLENYKADKITLNEVQDIREDERSGAKTKYYNLTAEHKIKPVRFEDIVTDSKSFVGFYQNKTTGVVRAVMQTSSSTDQYGNVTNNYKLVGQVKNDYIAQNRFYGNWTKIEPAEAAKLWNEELSKLPEFRKESLHLISGVVLPVWDKLPTENVRIYRVLTSDGEMLIGRVVSEDMIDETLRRLGSSRTKEKIATKDLVTGIKNGDTVHLENDWKIVQRKVSGENRIELVGPSYEHYNLLTKKGVFTERIQYNTRYFIPSDTNTIKIIDEILKLSPVMRVENAKYFISESEERANEQTGNDLLSRNGGRELDESTGKQSEKISRFKQEIKGKTRAERQSYAKELLEKKLTEEVIDGTHRYNLIKPEAYNDDMLSIVAEAKANGKDVGFFVGHGQRKFDGQRAFLIDGIKLTDTKIILRYDGVYPPQALLRHEEIHTDWNAPEIQASKEIILKGLSDAEKERLLADGRYKDYMDLYENNEDAVWEEFIADVFSGMNDYTSDYIDIVSDYWYSGEGIDTYSPAVYNSLIDAGGMNASVLDNIGFGNEANESLYSSVKYWYPDLPKNKLEALKRKIKNDIETSNRSITDTANWLFTDIEGTKVFAIYSTENTADPTLLYESKDDRAIAERDFLLDFFERGRTNEDFDRKSRFIDGVSNGSWLQQSSGGSHSAGTVGRGRSNRNAGVLPRQSKGKSSRAFRSVLENILEIQREDRRNSGISERGTGGVKYTLNTYDSDAEELTPERRAEIHKQWDQDNVDIEKPTKRQLFGEFASYIAHNMTRVFPNIPERGEKGTFFAEFRKYMIQWSKLGDTASFMVQDKLNKMTEGLTTEEFKTFSELVYFLDLQEETQIQKDKGYTEILLPNEITPSEVDAIVKELEAESTEAVKQALIRRQSIWDDLKTKYIDLNNYIGFDTDGKFKRKNYYHHQVIEYMNDGGKGTGSREIGIKAGRGWLKERHGSTKATNTNFLLVEHKALLQMQYDVYVANMLGKIKDQYDIKPQLEQEAFRNNKNAINELIRKEASDKDGNIVLDSKGNPDSETYRQQKWYNQRIMFGFSGLFDLADRGELPTYDGEYSRVVDALKRHDLNAPGLYKYVGIIASTTLPDNATDAQEQAVMNARTVLKYTSQKRAWIKEILADNYQTWETIAKSMSDTHTIHQPRRGNYFFNKTVVDDNAFNKAYNEMILSLASGEIDLGSVDINNLFTQYSDTVRLMGAAYEQWVLPNEIVTTMNEIANPKQTAEAAKAARYIISLWKGWATSVNPLRTVKFGLRNMAGDLDAVIAGKPQVVMFSKKAVEDIYQAMRHKKYSTDFMEWVERGGYTSMIFANEMDTEMQDKLFSHLKNKQGMDVFKIPAKLIEKYYNGVETVHNFREAILRYSAYLYFKEAIKRNSGVVKDYVASNRYIVRGLNTAEDKAYQLSKDLLGAYDEVGKMGQTLRRYWIPFYSFTETNLKRYYRMFENIITSDDKIPKKAGKLLLKVLMANMLGLLMVAWNRLVMKDEDDKLPPSVRDVPHITLGQLGDDVYAFRQLGSFSELLEWIGLDDYKWTDEDLTAPLDKAWGMITPFFKMPIELVSGLNFYPSLTEPSAIRDKWQHFFNSLGVDDVYSELTGKPTKGWGEAVKGAFVYNYDYKESAYYEILDIKRKYQGNTDNTIYGIDKKSNALYYMKKAVRYKDKEAALKYLDQYFENGGTVRGIKQSFSTLNPMYGFTGKDTAEKGVAFIASLTEDQKEKLKIAQDYYESDLMLPENVLAMLGKKDITQEEAKNVLKNYIKAKCK